MPVTGERPIRAPRRHRVRCAVEIDAPVDEVFDLWTRFEALPRVLHGVRRVKHISARRILWDVEIAGRQFVWEAEVTELQPPKRIEWVSRSGTPNEGELRFEALTDGGTRLDVEIACEPRGPMQRLGARLDLARKQVDRDLAAFRRFVDDVSREP